MTMTTQWTVNAIKDAMRARGSHWWDPAAFRFFGTKVLPTVYQGPGGIYFVTSEQPPHDVRKYSVRQFNPYKADVDTIGEVATMGRGEAITEAKRLAKTPLQEQWLKAFRALDEALTGADLGKTFNEAGNYVSLADAIRHEILYFAGDGGYTRAIVREYSDGSGVYLDLIETGATDRKKAWSDAYKFQQEAKRILWTYATDAFVAEQGDTTEEYKPVTVLEQFVHDLQAHGCKQLSDGDARSLMRRAKQHHTYMEAMCSDEGFCRGVNEDGEHPAVVTCRKGIELFAANIGAKGVLFSGDPRGCTVRLTFHDGFVNDYAREGYCVPTGEDE